MNNVFVCAYTISIYVCAQSVSLLLSVFFKSSLLLFVDVIVVVSIVVFVVVVVDEVPICSSGTQCPLYMVLPHWDNMSQANMLTHPVTLY